MKLVLIYFLISFSILAQFTPNDKELVRTTFTREFDKIIIDKYLHSNNSSQVKAGLLAVSHSNDTNFVDRITQLDFDTYGDYISFALGQIGVCQKSSHFLLDKLNKNGKFNKEILEAIGKTGTKEDLDSILKINFPDEKFNSGKSLALTNFNGRNIKSQEGINFLHNEIQNSTGERLFNALFAISRIGADSTFQEALIKIIKQNSSTEELFVIKQYALSSLRKIKHFPDDLDLLNSLLKNKDWRIRTEAVKCAAFFNFKNSSDPDNYLKLFEDENPNVARQAVISLRSIELNPSIKVELKNKIKRKLQESNSFTQNTIGELFISYIKLYPEELFETIKLVSGKVKDKFIFDALSENTNNPEQNFNYLKTSYSKANCNDKLHIVNALLTLLTKLTDDAAYNNTLIENLESDCAPVISIVADGLDSLFVVKHKEKLIEVINKQVSTFSNNSEYSESIISLANLAKKIDGSQFKNILGSLKESELFSVKNFALKELGLPAEKKDISNFEAIWQNAFKYKSAKIITNKGNFTINFSPQYSPISVGNFCLLAFQGYFDNVVYHRVVPNFVIQTGDKTGTGWGGPGYEIVSELSPVPYDRACVGMASAGKDTEGSQWFVMHSSFPHLNSRYSNFGKVTEGMDVVDCIDEGDSIMQVELFLDE